MSRVVHLFVVGVDESDALPAQAAYERLCYELAELIAKEVRYKEFWMFLFRPENMPDEDKRLVVWDRPHMRTPDPETWLKGWGLKITDVAVCRCEEDLAQQIGHLTGADIHRKV